MAPRVFRAPEGPAAREARASLRSAPRLEARPCPPDPPAPSTPVGPGVLTCACTSARSPARPRRRPRAPQPGPASKPVQASLPPTGTAARPSGPSCALHTSGAWPLWCRPWASQGPSELRFLADLLLVVTNVVNRRCFCVDFRSVVTNVVNPTAFSLKIVVFGRRLTTYVTRVLARGFTLLRFDDVCNVVCPPALRPGPPAPPVVCVFWIGSFVVDRNGASG